jgi:hypothetical protein
MRVGVVSDFMAQVEKKKKKKKKTLNFSFCFDTLRGFHEWPLHLNHGF